MTLVKNLKRNLINVPGWRSGRRLVVFESDDWGMVRMPSRRAFDNLLRSGIRVDKSRYDSLDCLESQADLQALFDLLSRYRDRTDRAPVFTFNTVMGNPDFPRIEASEFSQYYHEHLFASYLNYTGADLEPLWRQAIDARLIRPQFHAREHVNVALWMQALQRGDRETRLAFDQRFFGLKTTTPSPYQRHFLAAYHATSSQDLSAKLQIIKEGLELFEATFGHPSLSFIPCNYVWSTELEPQLNALGIRVLQGQIGQLDLDLNNGGKKVVRRHYLGQRNDQGQIYLMRNCLFEPAADPDRDWVDTCLADIETAFRWRKPAIISTHRINYVSGMQVANRDRGLTLLERLLKAIEARWPGTEYLSSDELGELILSTHDDRDTQQ
jgi:hypothetical protein